MAVIFENTGLGFGNFLHRIAQIVRVVQTDIGDDCHLRRVDDIGGVQRAAHAHLQYHDVAILPGKIHKANGGDQFKFRRLFIHCLGKLLHIFGNGSHILVGNLLPVHLNPLVKAINIRRGVKAHLITCLLQDGCGHGGGTTLAVGAGNVDEFQLLLRVAQPTQQFLCPGKTGDTAFPEERVDIFDSFLCVHLFFVLSGIP